MAVRNRANSEHYTWGGACDGWQLLAGADLCVIEERIPPGLGEVRHYHRRARQLFYVLRGELEIETAAGRTRLGEGDALEVPPGEAHRVWNSLTEDVRFLVVSAPTTRGDRIEVGE